MKVLNKICLLLLLTLYLMILTKQILFKYIPISEIIHHFSFDNHQPFWRSNNFVPFKTIKFYLFLADIKTSFKIENLAGNVVGFVPLGILTPLISNKFRRFTTVLLTTLALSLTYEILQLLFEFGSFDVDDLILNTLGGAIGYMIFKIIYYTNKKNL